MQIKSKYRLVTKASISSIKRIHGADCRANRNDFLISASASPLITQESDIKRSHLQDSIISYDEIHWKKKEMMI
jgi:hypothetical protein